ncbi:MAG: flagellar basal body-associated FliL family protein [Cellvibrio sp.]
MAAGKKDEKADKEKDQAPADDAAVAEAKKKKKKLFMFIGLAILLVLISVGATFFIVSKMMAKNSDSEEEAESSEAVEEVVAAPAIYYPLKPNFTVNYDVNGRQRFLQAELTLMYRDPAVLKTLELHMPAVRNGLVMLLSSQVFDELQTVEGKEKLRASALTTIQELINKEAAAAAEKSKEKDGESEDEEEEKKGKSKSKDKKAKPPEPNIEQVLFTQFVMQ